MQKPDNCTQGRFGRLVLPGGVALVVILALVQIHRPKAA